LWVSLLAKKFDSLILFFQFVSTLSLPGHEGWISSLSFCNSRDDDGGPTLTLASASQDATIRLWIITPAAHPMAWTKGDTLNDEMLDAFEASLEDAGEEGGKQVSLKKHTLSVKLAAGM
jgi:WD40 repeat protein